MELIVKINSQTVGRDKLARFIQYSCKALWYTLQEHKLGSHESIEKFRTLEYTFGTFRKLLRLGRFIESLHSALKCLQYSDPVIRLTSTLSKISHAVFLLCDHILWIGRAGIMDIRSNKWVRLANKYWLLSICMNLVRDYYELKKIFQILPPSHYRSVTSLHRDVVVDTVRNVCDIFIPLTALGHTGINPGLIGLLGTISSLLGILPLIDPRIKLIPP